MRRIGFEDWAWGIGNRNLTLCIPLREPLRYFAFEKNIYSYNYYLSKIVCTFAANVFTVVYTEYRNC